MITADAIPLPLPEALEAARAAVAEARSSVRFDGVLAEACEVRFIPAARDTRKTACWSWLESGPKHLILFGERIAERCRSGLVAEYFLLYWRHELQHALSTYRDLAGLSIRLKAEGIPFSLLNLAEDARIEHLARQSDGPFGWLKHEDAPEGFTAPAILLRLIQAEGDLDIAQVGLDFTEGSVLPAWLRISRYYYPAFIKCADTLSLLPILHEWIVEFPEDEKPEGGQPGDMEHGAELQSNGDALEQAMAESESLDSAQADAELDSAPEEDHKAGPSFKGGVKPTSTLDEAFFEDSDLFTLDRAKINRIYGILAAGIRVGMVRVPTSSPTSRLSLRAFVRGSPRPFRTLQKEQRGKPTIVWFHDCSGSMQNQGAGQEGLHILAALNLMAQKGMICCKAIFTKGDSQDIARNFCVNLPLPTKDLQRLAHDGSSECFNRAMITHAATLQKADLVLAFTDGQISDDPINHRFWHASGVFSVGLFVGDPASTSTLGKWFNSGIVRDTVENLSLALNSIIRKNL